MKQLFTLVIIFIGIHYSAADTNHVADLRVGTITLLDGYTNKTENGTDSTPGRITRADGNFVINYDIGFLAGYHIYPAHKSDYSWYREQVINGQKACLGILKEKESQYLIVTIYSSPTEATGKPANFSAKITSQDEIADALLMLGTFKFTAKD